MSLTRQVDSFNNRPILDVQNLKTWFHTQDGIVYAVNGVSFKIHPGELLGVVGESGSGKSVTVMSLLKLIPMPPGEISSGTAIYNDQDLLTMSQDEIRDIRGSEIGFIFQDPMTSLNPVLTIGYQLTEPLRVHKNMSRKEANAQAVELLKLVGIPMAESRLNDFPHQFSGGMRQRVMIAIALICSPPVLIADEPTTALDVTIQAQIVEIVKQLREKMGMAVIWITHDLGVMAGLADRIMVMYGGLVVERADVKELYGRPQHPYTLGLLGSLPRVDQHGEDLINIKGQPPNMLMEPTSCSFAPRCQYAYARCFNEIPHLEPIDTGHEVACWWDIAKGEPRYGK
jgi:peptide/nickel transport system ATP-binding protein